MDMSLRRIAFGPHGIISRMHNDDGPQFWTLEHAYANGSMYQPKIPDGAYSCVRRLSPKFGYDVFMLENVPDCSFIEIHIGNFNQDSEGCILLGVKLGPDGQSVLSSAQAFDQFMLMQTGVQAFKLTVISQNINK